MLTVLMLSALVAAQPPQAAAVAARLQVFLDCTTGCFADYLRDEIRFVNFVRDRVNADVHVLISSTGTGGGGSEYTLSLIGARAFQGQDRRLRAVTGPGDTEDMQRRHLLNTLRLALLDYLAKDGVPQNLTVDVRLDTPSAGAAPRRDPWNSWVFSLRGSASFEGEESNKQRQVSFDGSADRITPDWKTTLGVQFEQETEEFDLDEDDPVKVTRHEREFNWLIVKALGEHWSIGARGEIESSTFDNTKIRYAAAPAIEYNFFPYSTYTRRQLRVLYAAGPRHQKYYEETLFQKLQETLAQHALSVTYDQREPWGSVEGRLEWTQFLHDLGKNRLEADGEISWRVVRGLSVSASASASRIRDQLSLRRRGATPEEVLLELRELQSGYDYDFSLSLTYTFGSIFSSIVNPRFGQ
jgi:hypothetical protein